MAWLYVIIAGVFEVIFAVSLKNSAGFTRPGWILAFLVAATVSFVLLSQGLKHLPVGAAYAVWTGIGAAGTAVVGMLVLGESRDAFRILSIALIVGGVIGLQLTSSASN